MSQNDKLSFLEQIKIFNVLLYNLIIQICVTIFKFFTPKNKKNVRGQLALITGGSQGIGRAIAFRLAQEGCRIAIVNRNLKTGQEVANKISKSFKNIKVQAFSCDVSKVDEVKKLKIDVEKSLGCVDILVNNAGVLGINLSLLEGDNDQDYQNMMDVNATSYIWTCRAFLPGMIKRQRGHIVGISSAFAINITSVSTVYTATKCANKGFMRALREEMSFYGFDKFIKTTCVYPALVETNDEMSEMARKYFYQEIIPLNDKNSVAEAIVNGLLKDYENIYVPTHDLILMFICSWLPLKVRTLVFKNVIRKNFRDEYLNMKREKIEI